MDALNKFDPAKRVQFKTYAEFRIKGAMLDELRSLDWVSRSVRQKAAQLERAYQTLEKKRGRAVEDEEVAKEMAYPWTATTTWSTRSTGCSWWTSRT